MHTEKSGPALSIDSSRQIDDQVIEIIESFNKPGKSMQMNVIRLLKIAPHLKLPNVGKHIMAYPG